jgi:hypothetical protein
MDGGAHSIATIESWLVILIAGCVASILLCAVAALFTRFAKLWFVVKAATAVLLVAGVVLAVLDHIGFR